MSKEDIFSKIQIVDYNNVLENVLEKKDFTVDVKNLLLDMFYKIENGYEDYKVIKVNVASKKVFLKKVVEIIEKKCNRIDLIKPMSEESKELEEQNTNYIVDKEKGFIKVYHNERMMLEALILLNQNDIYIDEKYELYENAIKFVLLKGDVISNSEVIRDFDGWSWGITPSQIMNKNVNIIYQNLLMLLGNSFIQKWITGVEEDDDIEIPSNEILRSKYNSDFGLTKEEIIKDQKVDYIKLIKEKIQKKCGKENAEKFFDKLLRASLVIGCNNDNAQKEKILNEIKKINEELDSMKDNRVFLEGMFEKKKKISAKIKDIDKILSNEELLKEDYKNRNEKLQNKDKIFSVSHLALMYKKARKDYLKEIDKCNKMMEPKEFVNHKIELESLKSFYDSLEITKEEKTDESPFMIELQIAFLSCIQYIVAKVENKFEIEDLLYEVRYYKYIPYNSGNLGKSAKLKNQLNDIEKILIPKACNIKILIEISENKELNFNLLKNIFESKIANLGNMYYELKYHKGIIKITIYDTNVEENVVEQQITENVELKVKLNKKIKIFE